MGCQPDMLHIDGVFDNLTIQPSSIDLLPVSVPVNFSDISFEYIYEGALKLQTTEKVTEVPCKLRLLNTPLHFPT